MQDRDAPSCAGRHTTPRDALQHDDDRVDRQPLEALQPVQRRDQAGRRAGAVAPPAVRPAAHDVRRVDEQPHRRSVPHGWRRTRAAHRGGGDGGGVEAPSAPARGAPVSRTAPWHARRVGEQSTGLRRTDLRDAGLALAAAVVHVGAVFLADRWPLELDFSFLFEGLPAVLAVVAAVVVVVRADRRPLAVACFWAWAMAVFTVPAYFLGLWFVPTAVLLSVPFWQRD